MSGSEGELNCRAWTRGTDTHGYARIRTDTQSACSNALMVSINRAIPLAQYQPFSSSGEQEIGTKEGRAHSRLCREERDAAGFVVRSFPKEERAHAEILR